MKTAILGGGCFWCIEAAFKHVKGVKKVESGYAGGNTKNPTYKQVSTGKTGHAEVVKIKYDENQIKYKEILEKFFKIHNPFTKNKEGPDKGSQYRSIILYQNEEQKKTIENFIKQKQSESNKEIVTEVKKLQKFYKAEEEHQNYFEKYPNKAYCKLHVKPKVEKIKEE